MNRLVVAVLCIGLLAVLMPTVGYAGEYRVITADKPVVAHLSTDRLRLSSKYQAVADSPCNLLGDDVVFRFGTTDTGKVQVIKVVFQTTKHTMVGILVGMIQTATDLTDEDHCPTNTPLTLDPGVYSELGIITNLDEYVANKIAPAH